MNWRKIFAAFSVRRNARGESRRILRTGYGDGSDFSFAPNPRATR